MEEQGGGAEKEGGTRRWLNVVAAAVLMVGTLPGRTQGLGLITEPMLRDLDLDRLVYANINLWATLLGAAFCFPAGWLLDRFGLRWTSAAMVVGLGAVVWAMSATGGGVTILFVLILLTRAIGQSALSVASITVVAKTFSKRIGVAMGVYSVLLSVFFAAAFLLVGSQVRTVGWRTAWSGIAMALIAFVTPISLLFVSENNGAKSEGVKGEGLSLKAALRTRAFWIFSAAAAMYGLVSSGLGLFNEAVLAERGFDQKAYHTLLGLTTMLALIGQFGCGALTIRWPMQRLLGIAMLIYAAALCVLPFVKTPAQLWAFAVMMGISGGMVTVLFFAVWRVFFGAAELGRIQGAAQMLTVFASAIGPLLFAKSAAAFSSYSPILLATAGVVVLFGIAAWRSRTVFKQANVA